MPIVRTTINPHTDLEVSESEAIILGSQGLLLPAVDEPTPAPKGADRKPLEG